MRLTPALTLVASLALIGCTGDAPEPTAPEAFTVPAFDRGGVHGDVATQFRAAGLKGRNEIPERDSGGTGAATFALSEDGQSLRYKLIVANIDDVTQSHIHVGARNENGPVVAFLFGFDAAGATTNGILAQGSIEASDLVGPLAGQPLSALIDAMRSGNTYVNVHTIVLPPGEIRAQIH